MELNEENMSILIIYHRADFDGVASCLVCKHFLHTRGIPDNDITLMGWNYGDREIPLSTLLSYSYVYILDMHVLESNMLLLYKANKLTWIDHHITAIQDSINLGYSDCPGIRSTDLAACELTWNFFFPQIECPILIQWLGAWDVFNKTRFDWEGIVNPIQVSCSEKFGLLPKNWELDFPRILDNDKKLLNELISNGRLISSYCKKRSAAAVTKYAFDVLVAGKYKGICLINTIFGSTQFDSIISNYECCVVVNRKNANEYNFSIYVPENIDLDFNAGQFMQDNYKGGGHVRAAGGILNLDQFIKLITEGIIP